MRRSRSSLHSILTSKIGGLRKGDQITLTHEMRYKKHCMTYWHDWLGFDEHKFMRNERSKDRVVFFLYEKDSGAQQAFVKIKKNRGLS